MQSPEEKGHVRAERDKLNEDIDLIYRTLLVKEDESAGALSAGTARPGDGSARGEESGNAKQDLPGLEEGEIFLDDNDDRSSDREDSSSAVQTNIGTIISSGPYGSSYSRRCGADKESSCELTTVG